MTPALPLNAETLAAFPLPELTGDVDKEARGRVVLVGGCRELAGAALLSGTAALRVGAGKLQIATAASIAVPLAIAIPEARVSGYAETEEGGIGVEAADDLLERCERADAAVIGPGLVDETATLALVRHLLRGGLKGRIVLDAGALSVLAKAQELCRAAGGGVTLLPHAGEMAQLLGWERDAIVAEPQRAAIEAAELYGCTVAMKGAQTYVASPDGRCFRYEGGGVGLATGGSGDVLSGLVGGVAARGLDAFAATLWGVFLHGEAGKFLAQRVGSLGFLARELGEVIPGLLPRP